jgi:hypothetical protein
MTATPTPTTAPSVPSALDAYLTVTQGAKVLRVTRRWARMLAMRGQVRAIHSPYGWLIERESAQELAEQRQAALQAQAVAGREVQGA